MKKYIMILLIVLSIDSSAQYNTVDMFNSPLNSIHNENGYYYKDTTGYLNQFVGTWKYQDTTTTYIIEFDKRTFIRNVPHMNSTYKYDDLIGALKILKNGTVVYDDLNILTQDCQNATDFNISILSRVMNADNCYLCTYPKQRLALIYGEQDNDNLAYMDLQILIHTFQENGITKLRLVFLDDQINENMALSINDFKSAPAKTQLYLGFGIFDFGKVP